jgi:eukaryotic-like serine/threonine-protein kinase
VNLERGARLGSFEIVGPLGAGAMGAVYKARDTRLDRLVAIKVLSSDLAASPEARERFEREARTISQLSHPHICALFDVGRHEDVEFLVMELLEGETLAARLAKGALPMAQTLRFGIEIADALHAAHRQGIVHRDLKPANVMLTKSGVKLLDFGLAKSAAPVFAGPSGEAETAADVAQISQAGTIAGTLQYMSPEQLEGRSADARSDIFALGAVLYEMVSAKKAFAASSPIGVASAILHHHPPSLMAEQPATPTVLDRIVRGCLTKDPDERWQTAHDVKLQLSAVQEDSGIAPARESISPARSRSWLPWAIAAASMVVAAGAASAALWMRAAPAPAPVNRVVRFSIPPPEGAAFSDTVETICIALSPDGSQLAFVAENEKGDRRVWMRSLAAVEARPVPGTEGARTVIWSPDGKAIAFFSGGKLKRLDLPDGAPVTLSDVPDVRIDATWGADYILFGIKPAAIYRVPSGGGAPVVERTPDRAQQEISVSWPSFLPDGRRYLYMTRKVDSATVMIGEIGKPGRPVLTQSGFSLARYVDPGHLVYVRDGTLLAQRFDVASERTVGDPFPVAEPVRYFMSSGAATLTAASGVLVYQSHAEMARLAWIDHAGKETGTIGTPGGYGRLRLSPDGRQLLFDRAQASIGTYDLFRFDIDRGIEQRLTSDRLSEIGGTWLPGATAAMYSAGAPPHLFRKDLATGREEQVLPPPGFQLTEDLSPDGTTFVFTQRTERGNFDIWSMPLDRSRPPAPLAETPFDEASVRFAPDGRSIAFASDESGRYEVYAAAFPMTGERVRISPAGGNQPRWSRNGRMLYYLAGDLQVMAVPVQSAMRFGAPHALFAIARAAKWDDVKYGAGWSDFDVSADDTRFLASIPLPGNQQPLTGVIHFLEGARK